MSQKITVFWFRRDLRLHDNAGLYKALKGPNPVLPLFIFDKNILDKLEEKHDRRLTYIAQELDAMQQELSSLESRLQVRYGFPIDVWKQLTQDFEIAAVYTNHDYEPYAKERDSQIADLLKERGIKFKTYKDQVIFEKDEVMTGQGKFYSVFTPYSKTWKSKLNDFYLKSYPNEKYFGNFYKEDQAYHRPSLEEMGFQPQTDHIPDKKVSIDTLKAYHDSRDIPGGDGTTRVGVHLRFGTLSIRKMAQLGLKNSSIWLNELIWRDFYAQVLHHNPRIENESFRKKYDNIPWRNNEEEFNRWCNGQTGVPIVDAGMKELNQTGYMHNRVRMITASYLTKHLLIDWRWGEAYFGKKLLDYDLASNNGGWQWACGSGTDAAPYFRVFNPQSQTEKFDPQHKYISKWVPEAWQPNYIKPIIEHKAGRERALKVYKEALSES